MNMMAQWEDETNHRQIQFSIEYTIDNATGTSEPSFCGKAPDGLVMATAGAWLAATLTLMAVEIVAAPSLSVARALRLTLPAATLVAVKL